MLKLRLKRVGRKALPSYRIVVIEQKTKRDGYPIEEVGYYNPITKRLSFNIDRVSYWLKIGVKPSLTVISLLKKSNITEC